MNRPAGQGELRLQGLLRNQALTGPQSVHFDIANACNTRCVTCWHHSRALAPDQRPGADWRRRTLPLATFSAIIDDLLQLGGLEQVILSGMGEPTLNPELYAMVRLAHEASVGVTVITNLLRADLPRLVDSPGELALLVSVCGVTEPVWQAFHDHPRDGGFERLVRQLELLAERGFRPKMVQVINAQNFHQLEQMVSFGQRYGARRVSFKLASLGRGTEVTALDPDQLQQLRTRLLPRALEAAARVGLQTDLADFALQLSADPLRTAPVEQVGCYMGLLYCRVTVDARLLYCCNPEVEVGRISAEQSLSRLWRSERYQRLRLRLRQRRFFPGCGQCGKLKQNLKWSRRLRALRRGTR